MIRQSFNSDWTLMNDKKSSLGTMTKRCKTIPVQIPHDAMIHEERTPDTENQSQTGFYPGGQYVYIKKFYAEKQWKEKTVIIEFEGVYQTAMVYLNGHLVAHNLYGYSNFYAVLDSNLIYGEINELKVIANNSAVSNSRWYSGSGIYRDVKLMVGSRIHVPADGVKITTITANEEIAVVELEISIRNLEHKKDTVSVVTDISDSGKVVSSEKTKLTMFPNEEELIRQRVCIKTPKLWNCDTPNLYECRVSVVLGEKVIDETIETIGIRTISLEPINGLQINGKRVKLRGACIHHDNGIIGAASFEKAEERKIKLLKEAGFNSIRSSHHPISKSMMRACDRYGVLVMDELSDVWTYHKNPHDFAIHFTDYWEQEVERMVKKDYNHPSVIFYSAGNEIPEVGLDSGAQMKRRICNKFHELDKTRYTTDGINGSMSITYGCGMESLLKDMLGDSLDMGGMNGANALNAYMSLKTGERADEFACHPFVTEAIEESVMASDVTGLNYLTGRHVLEKNLHPNKTVIGAETYPADIVRLWKLVKENPHILGDYTWAGHDYLGEAGCGIFHYDGTANFSNVYPERTAYIGDLDLIGYRRPISYLREIVFGLRKQPYIAVERLNRYGMKPSKTAWMYKDNIESWTWPGYEGKPAIVDVYADAEEVELFLNGKSLGKKSAGEENSYTATYELLYVPGELEAVAYNDSKEIGRYKIKTSGSVNKITAVADTSILKAGGEDLAFITIFLTDQEGNRNMYEQKLLRIDVKGEGVLQGFGSANPCSLESYDSTECNTYDGYAMAVVRAGQSHGKIQITISAKDCEDNVIELLVN